MPSSVIAQRPAIAAIFGIDPAPSGDAARTPLGTFDVIFCRNVLIYFDQDTKINIFGRLAKIMEADGFLVLGAAETVVGLTDVFKPFPDKRGLYRPSGARAAPAPVSVATAMPRMAATAGR